MVIIENCIGSDAVYKCMSMGISSCNKKFISMSVSYVKEEKKKKKKY